AGAAWARPQRRDLPPQCRRPERRVLHRARPDEGRGARLFRPAALASRHAATPEGLGAQGRARAVGPDAGAGFPARARVGPGSRSAHPGYQFIVPLMTSMLRVLAAPGTM